MVTAFALPVLLMPAHTFAQDGMGVRVQPSILDERADPGTAIDGVLTVTNEDGGKQAYTIETRNIENMDESGRPQFSKESPTDPMLAASWIKLSMTTIELDQGQAIEVPYRIEVPKEASPGSYFAALFLAREAQTPTANGAGVGFQVASLIDLRVNGDALESLIVRQFSTNKTFYTQPSVVFTTHLENVGSVHERPQGIIEITDLFGKKVDQVTFNVDKGGIMPRNDRIFTTNWSSDKFTLGKYRALASIVFGDTDKQTVTREVTFWVVPIQEVGLVLGGIVLVAFLLTWGMRRYVRNALARAGHAGALERSETVNASFAKRLIRTLVWLLVLLTLLFIGILVFFA